MSSASIAFVLFSTALSIVMIPGLALLHLGLATGCRRGRGLSVVWPATVASVSLVVVALGPAVVAGDSSSAAYVGIPGVAGLDIGLLPVSRGFADLPEASLVGALRTAALLTAAAGVIAGVVSGMTSRVRAVSASVLWACLVLLPVSTWVYAVRWDGRGFVGGWLGAGLHPVLGVGALDYGGGAVHVALGASLLALAALERKRGETLGGARTPGGAIPLLGGAFLLWVGSVAAAAGSEGLADEVASLAVMNALCAPAAAGIAWMIVEHIRDGRSSVSGGVRGIVAGVAVVSAGSGYLTPSLALALGLGMGALGAFAVRSSTGGSQALRSSALLHLLGGATGIIALGFAAQGQGMLYSGSVAQLCAQFVLCVAVGGYAYLVTGLLARVGRVASSTDGMSAEAESVQETVLA